MRMDHVTEVNAKHYEREDSTIPPSVPDKWQCLSAPQTAHWLQQSLSLVQPYLGSALTEFMTLMLVGADREKKRKENRGTMNKLLEEYPLERHFILYHPPVDPMSSRSRH